MYLVPGGATHGFRGSGPNPSGSFKHSRVESGRVKRCSIFHGSDRFASQENFKSHGSRRVGLSRVGSGHPYPIRTARNDPSHEKPAKNDMLLSKKPRRVVYRCM